MLAPPVTLGLDAAAWLLSRFLPERTVEVRVPVSGLTHKQWLEFVRVCCSGEPNTITPSHRLGAFEMTVRRLCDLGVMDKPRLVHRGGGQVWNANWLRPKSFDSFANDPMLQYLLFAESMKRYADDGAVQAHVGYRIDDEVMTLSGALAVAHRAGLPGLLSWVVRSDERRKFARNTTDFFQRANTIF